MRRSVWMFVFCICVLGLVAGTASAKTPDGKTPSVETICDNETGAAFGLCNAYCEAMDCTDPNQRASNTGCESVRANFEKHTGRALPCTIPCPCPRLLQLFADIENGTVTIVSCISNGIVYVTTDDGTVALVDGRDSTCSINDTPPKMVLTHEELQVCGYALRRAAAAQGIVCQYPE